MLNQGETFHSMLLQQNFDNKIIMIVLTSTVLSRIDLMGKIILFLTEKLLKKGIFKMRKI